MEYFDLSLRVALVGLVVLIALIGFLYITRGTAVRHVRGAGADGTTVAPSDPQFPLSITLLTGAVLAPGNQVELAVDGDGTYPRLWEDLRSAERFIFILMYFGNPGRLAPSARHRVTGTG